MVVRGGQNSPMSQVIPIKPHRSPQELDLETVSLHEILVTLEACTVLPPKQKWPFAQRFFGASGGVFVGSQGSFLQFLENMFTVLG